MQGQWQPIATAPKDCPVDVFYVNDSFEKPIEGVIYDARLERSFWVGTNGAIPERYIVSWADKSVSLQATGTRG